MRTRSTLIFQVVRFRRWDKASRLCETVLSTQATFAFFPVVSCRSTNKSSFLQTAIFTLSFPNISDNFTLKASKLEVGNSFKCPQKSTATTLINQIQFN